MNCATAADDAGDPPMAGPSTSDGIAIIVPACLQVREIFEILRENIRSFRHDAVRTIIVLCNRLSLMQPSTLESLLSLEVGLPVQVVADKERSVAGAWNYGIELALKAGLEQFLITAVDVAFTRSTVDKLLEFGRSHGETDIWSGTETTLSDDGGQSHRDACDFSCVMLRRGTIERHGWFDKEFKPAYFEDNDYVTRLVLNGNIPKQLLDARHFHQRSLTVRLDPEMAHHVGHWFGTNEARFHAKWRSKIDDYRLIAEICFKTPFNSGKPTNWWPEQMKVGYSPSAGIHE